ncbi:MAG TPA: DinB family protein, partial [Chryseosolibacter sp.]
DFPPEYLWKRPADVASVGFHLLHIRGVIDRLFTYARGEALNASQLDELTAEKQIPAEVIQPSILVNKLRLQLDKAITQLKNTPGSSLTEGRTIGRKQIPTTVQGLLFHAAEHSQRHVGQLLVTARVVRANLKSLPSD